MKIGVVSDTHNRGLPQQMLDDFQDADLIIHAGDSCSLDHIDLLRKITEVIAVCGNMDDTRLRECLKNKVIFKKKGISFGVCHGKGPAKKVIDFIINEFKKDKIDVAVFGHSHIPFNEVINGVLYFNPGSPNDTFCTPYCSYGILEIKDDKVSGKIIKVK